MDNEWKHRTRVYKFGVVWHWKCRRPNCEGGRSRQWSGALLQASMHTCDHGKYPHWPVDTGSLIR